MKVRLNRKLLVHKQTDSGGVGEEYIANFGEVCDLTKDEAYHLIKLGMADELKFSEKVVPKKR